MRKPFSGLSLSQIDPVLQKAGSIDFANLVNISQSQPEPFTLSELETIIGPISDLLQPDLTLGFSSDQGSEACRSSIASLYSNLSADRVITFAGAQEAIFCSLHALLEKTDEVIAIKPIYDPLIRTAEEIGCNMKYVHLEPAQDHSKWVLDLDQLTELISDKTKLLILNFPHNPTGAMITSTELDQIIQTCRKNNVWILSDEVFRGLEHQQTDRLPAVADLYEQAISLGVMSKAFALPALRVGWAASQDKDTLRRMLEVKEYLSVCNSLIDEHITSVALKNAEKIIERNRTIFLPQLKKMHDFFTQNKHFQWINPSAGSCAYVLFDQVLMSKQEQRAFFKQQAEINNLRIISGAAFLANLKKYAGFRIGFGFENNLSEILKLASVK